MPSLMMESGGQTLFPAKTSLESDAITHDGITLLQLITDFNMPPMFEKQSFNPFLLPYLNPCYTQV